MTTEYCRICEANWPYIGCKEHTKPLTHAEPVLNYCEGSSSTCQNYTQNTDSICDECNPFLFKIPDNHVKFVTEVQTDQPTPVSFKVGDNVSVIERLHSEHDRYYDRVLSLEDEVQSLKAQLFQYQIALKGPFYTLIEEDES